LTPELPRGNRSFTFEWVPLDKHVLLVDVKSDLGRHGSYIGAVDGMDYNEEALMMAANGSPVWDLFSEIFFDPIKQPYESLLQKEQFEEKGALAKWVSFREGWPPSVIEVRALDEHVLSVAVERPGHTWRAYIGPLRGIDYYKETLEIIVRGSEMPFDLAWVCFRDLGKATEIREGEWHIPPPEDKGASPADGRNEQESP